MRLKELERYPLGKWRFLEGQKLQVEGFRQKKGQMSRMKEARLNLI